MIANTMSDQGERSYQMSGLPPIGNSRDLSSPVIHLKGARSLSPRGLNELPDGSPHPGPLVLNGRTTQRVGLAMRQSRPAQARHHNPGRPRAAPHPESILAAKLGAPVSYAQELIGAIRVVRSWPLELTPPRDNSTCGAFSREPAPISMTGSGSPRAEERRGRV